MSRPESQFECWLARLREHLRTERYGRGAVHNYPYAIRRFLRDRARRGQAIESVTPVDVEAYVGALRLRRRRGIVPAHSLRMHRAAIRMMLRLIHGEWPPEVLPTTVNSIADHEVVTAYDAWMSELRGLSSSTRRRARAETYRLLQWIGNQGKNLATLSVSDVDEYIAWRSISMRRTSIAELTSKLRGVLRYLNGIGKMPVDLSGEITGPPLYALEKIPSILRPEDLDRVLKAAKRDRSSLGRRDYAILMLLSTYGLRAGEILALRLSDIDWRHEHLVVRHSKTGVHSRLPLLCGPANALLDYLKYGRPTTTAREVFLRTLAPYQPICSTGALHCMVARRFNAVGVVLTGKRGSHVFRHSRAVSLLRGGVPLKVIGDVLGHRSERSTAVYLKLATEDLRAVALDVPSEVSP